MTWKFIYKYRQRYKIGPAHNRCRNWFPFTSKHTWMRFSKFWNTFPKVSKLTAWFSWRIASLNFPIAICPSIGPKERSRQALDRLPLVSNFLTNFSMQHYDGARLSPNSVRNAVWHALNEPVCQYLRTRNPRCSTECKDNSLGPLARDSLYIKKTPVIWCSAFRLWCNEALSVAEIVCLPHYPPVPLHSHVPRQMTFSFFRLLHNTC